MSVTQPSIHRPNGYEPVVAELRRIADALQTVPAGCEPFYVSLGIQPGVAGDFAAAAAVDTVALAVLGKKGETAEFGGRTLREAAGDFRPVRVSIYQRLPEPRTELVQLRARVAELEAANARKDEQATGDPGTCPTCGSSDPTEMRMTGCGFKCDDPSRWHATAKQATGDDSRIVHYLEPGSDGYADDRMACGQRFGDAVKTGSYTGVLAKVTCPGCRPVADEWSD